MQDTSATLTKMTHFFRGFEGAVHWTGYRLNWIAYIALGIMMVGTCTAVISRYVFNYTILGVYDVTGLIAVLVVAFGLTQTQIARGHISINYFTLKLGQRARAIVASVTWFISFGLFVVITWRLFAQAYNMQRVSDTTMTVLIPISPFAYALAVASALLCLVLLIDFTRSLAEARRK